MPATPVNAVGGGGSSTSSSGSATDTVLGWNVTQYGFAEITATLTVGVL